MSRERWASALDAVAVLVFVLVGRASHDESEGLAGVLRTVWPFAAGLVVGWVLLVRVGWATTALRAGLLAALATAWLGLALRAVSGQGVAASFAVVATVVLTVFLVGWRLLARVASRVSNRSDRGTAPNTPRPGRAHDAAG